ncbi:MAG: hypothetical protein F6J96_27930 [Symploca sp. SIO1C2]|nr:hypothetical protein [Symploca sp. SIO1C2]
MVNESQGEVINWLAGETEFDWLRSLHKRDIVDNKFSQLFGGLNLKKFWLCKLAVRQEH